MRYINTLGHIYDMDPLSRKLKTIYRILADGEDKEKLAFWEGELTRYIHAKIKAVGKKDEKLEEKFLPAIQLLVEDAKEHMQTHIRFQTGDKDIVMDQVYDGLIKWIDVLLAVKSQGKKPSEALNEYRERDIKWADCLG